MLISTYGRDTELCEVVKENCDSMGLSVMYVKKTGPKLRSKLNNLKYISLGEKYGHSRPCGKPWCKCCPLMSGNDFIFKGHSKLKTAKGNCKTKFICYCARCKICSKKYVGKSTQECHCRLNGHRDCLKQYVNSHVDIDSSQDKDKFSLAWHLDKEHNIRSLSGLDDHFEFTILEKCTPKNLELKEHLWIQKLRTITPYGLNLYSPLGIPLLV